MDEKLFREEKERIEREMGIKIPEIVIPTREREERNLMYVGLRDYEAMILADSPQRRSFRHNHRINMISELIHDNPQLLGVLALEVEAPHVYAGTSRLEPFNRLCGKGRRHASDGGAWQSALEEVFYRFAGIIDYNRDQGLWLSQVSSEENLRYSWRFDSEKKPIFVCNYPEPGSEYDPLLGHFSFGGGNAFFAHRLVDSYVNAIIANHDFSSCRSDLRGDLVSKLLPNLSQGDDSVDGVIRSMTIPMVGTFGDLLDAKFLLEWLQCGSCLSYLHTTTRGDYVSVGLKKEDYRAQIRVLLPKDSEANVLTINHLGLSDPTINELFSDQENHILMVVPSEDIPNEGLRVHLEYSFRLFPKGRYLTPNPGERYQTYSLLLTDNGIDGSSLTPITELLSEKEFSSLRYR